MIGRLVGILVEKSPPSITIDVNGIGYEIDVPMSTFYNLPADGAQVILHTHLIIREDGHFLYGFASLAERGAFRQLLKISGIGARTALAVLSGMSVTELAQAVTLQDAARLTRVPGIGKKTAERLLLELRDRLPRSDSTTSLGVGTGSTAADTSSDIMNALLALGYNEREALGALKALPADAAVADGIRQALKLLSKTS